MMKLIRPAALAVLLLVAPGCAIAETNSSETYRQLNLFGDVFERVRSEYVEPVKDEQLIEAAINGMLTSLDPHSSYLNAKEWEDMQVETRGEFGGLGLEVTMENGLVKVVSPIDDTPAFRAGLRPGDLIIQLNGDPVLGMSLTDAVDKMRGPVGSEIKLTIKRNDVADPFEVSLNRDNIKIQSVRSRLDKDVGYVRVTIFNEQTQSGLDKAIATIKHAAGAKLIGYVLDLRNNPGGLLDQAVSVSDTFINDGEIVSIRGRSASDIKRFTATPGKKLDGLPVVVLINGGSASASEIVAGALQDHHRAVIMGTQSFGKGSVQTIIPLAGHGAIRLTTARYYTPSGRSIQQLGITPDIEVRQAKIEELAPVQGRREADLKGALRNDTVATPAAKPRPVPAPQSNAAPGAHHDDTTPATPAADAAKPPADDQSAAVSDPTDYQLARAVDLLRGVALINSRAAN